MSIATFDDTDHSIIAALRTNARARLRELVIATGVARSTIHDRLRKLRTNGVRFCTLCDWEALGCSLLVCFIAPFSEKLIEHPSVNTAIRLAPDAMLLECVFPSMLACEAFRASIPNAKSYPVVHVLKREAFIPRKEAQEEK